MLAMTIYVIGCDDGCPSNYVAPEVKWVVVISSYHNVGLKLYTDILKGDPVQNSNPL